MELDPASIHPSLKPVAASIRRGASVEKLGLPEPQRLVAETLIALLGSARTPPEMLGYAGELNAALDAAPHLDDLAPLLKALRDARLAARGLESARSGMAGDLSLDFLALALDDLYTAVHGHPLENPARRDFRSPPQNPSP